MLDMNIVAAGAVLETYLRVDSPAMLWGPPGVGKSSIVKQIAKEKSWKVIDYRCSTRDPVSMMGLPDISAHTTRWKVPDEFPQIERDGAEGILLLDEINAAPPMMQAAAFGLVLDRQVGEYRLPKGWRVVGAGNRKSDKAAAQAMPTALGNRFAHIGVVADLECTVAHFAAKRLPAMLIAFLRFRPGLLHEMGEGDNMAFPTPRTWEELSKVMDVEDDMLRLRAFAGYVGEGAAGELENFIKLSSDLPSVDNIVRDPRNARLPKNTAAQFAITAALAHHADERRLPAMDIYVRRLPREFQVTFGMDYVSMNPALASTQTYVDWATTNQDVLFNN
jgi:hypothetical protein